MKKRIDDKLYKKIRESVPIVAVDGIIIKDGYVLLTKRAIPPFKGAWVLPGGRVEYNEPLKKAVVREVKEETGLKTSVRGLLGIYDKKNRDPRGHSIAVCFFLDVIGGKARSCDEVSDIKFFKKLPKKIGFDHRRIVTDAFKLVSKRSYCGTTNKWEHIIAVPHIANNFYNVYC